MVVHHPRILEHDGNLVVSHLTAHAHNSQNGGSCGSQSPLLHNRSEIIHSSLMIKDQCLEAVHRVNMLAL